MNEREDQILELRNKGKTLAEIGIQLGISKERVRQIIRDYKIKADIERAGFPMRDALDTRVLHCLTRASNKSPYHITVTDVSDILAEIIYITDDDFLRQRNADAISLERLHEIQTAIKENKDIIRCRDCLYCYGGHCLNEYGIYRSVDGSDFCSYAKGRT